MGWDQQDVWQSMNTWVVVNPQDLDSPDLAAESPQLNAVDDDLESSLESLIEKQRKLSTSNASIHEPVYPPNTQNGSTPGPSAPRSILNSAFLALAVMLCVGLGYSLAHPASQRAGTPI